MYGRGVEALASLVAAMFIGLIIFLPLGLWKLIEIAIWIFNHVEVGIK